MRFMVYNAANRGAANSAESAMVRMLGIYPSVEEADAAITKYSCGLETRMWPVTELLKSSEAAGSAVQTVHWRPITTLNLAAHAGSSDAAKAALQSEYASIEGRIRAWTAMRDQESLDVATAAETRSLRPTEELLALNALATAVPVADSAPVADTNGPRVGPVGPLEKAYAAAQSAQLAQRSVDGGAVGAPVPAPLKMPPRATALPRDAELRGQLWALVAILGDATAETSKRDIRRTLGASLPIDGTLSDADRVKAAEAQAALDLIVEEPLVAFLETSDDPEALEKKAADAAEAHEFKHADLVVVRLYEWIKLAHVRDSKATRVSRNKPLPALGEPLTA